MDTRTPAQKKSAARKHYLAGLYHNTFWASRTSQPILGTDVSDMTANSLIRNGWALLHVFTQKDGTVKATLGRSKTGSKNYDANCSLRNDGKLISEIPRYQEGVKVDMSVLMNAGCELSSNYLTRWY